MHIVPPQILPFTFGDETFNTGDSIGIQCMANKGDLPIEIRWIVFPFVHGEKEVTIVKLNPRTSSLSIISLEAIHRGTYKCIASNKAGRAEYSAELRVNGLFNTFHRHECPFRLDFPLRTVFFFFLLYSQSINFKPKYLHETNKLELIGKIYQKSLTFQLTNV